VSLSRPAFHIDSNGHATVDAKEVGNTPRPQGPARILHEKAAVGLDEWVKSRTSIMAVQVPGQGPRVAPLRSAPSCSFMILAQDLLDHPLSRVHAEKKGNKVPTIGRGNNHETEEEQ
jgi:hypothetical protein